MVSDWLSINFKIPFFFQGAHKSKIEDYFQISLFPFCSVCFSKIPGSQECYMRLVLLECMILLASGSQSFADSKFGINA